MRAMCAGLPYFDGASSRRSRRSNARLLTGVGACLTDTAAALWASVPEVGAVDAVVEDCGELLRQPNTNTTPTTATTTITAKATGSTRPTLRLWGLNVCDAAVGAGDAAERRDADRHHRREVGAS